MLTCSDDRTKRKHLRDCNKEMTTADIAACVVEEEEAKALRSGGVVSDGLGDEDRKRKRRTSMRKMAKTLRRWNHKGLKLLSMAHAGEWIIVLLEGLDAHV